MKFIFVLLIACSAPWSLAMPIVSEPYDPNESFDSEELMLNMTGKYLNVQSFDSYIQMGSFLQMIPEDIAIEWAKLNETQREEVVTFTSDVLHKRIEVPEDALVAEWLRENSPAVHAIFTSFNTTFYTHLNNLKPSTIVQLQEWRDEAADLFGNHRPATETTAQNLKLIRDYFIKIRQMKPEIREDLKSQFPWTMSIVEGPGFKLYIQVLTAFEKIFKLLGEVAGRKDELETTTGAPI